MAAKKFTFGPWLPDLPDLDNPGLTECLNVQRVSGSYKPYFPLSPAGAALPGRVFGARRCTYWTNTPFSNVFVGCLGLTNGAIFFGTGAGAGQWNDVSLPGATNSLFGRQFAQYNQYVFSTDYANPPCYYVIGSGVTPFTSLASVGAPDAQVIGVIGQFVMLGFLSSIASAAVQWSSINQPLQWPVPQSALAIASESGIQFLDPSLGVVLGISQGDQWGVILLSGGVVRVTYVGGNAVFQFDTIYRGPGPIGLNSWAKIGGLVYFLSSAGFYICDGVSVQPIGRGKVDSYFISHWNSLGAAEITCGADYKNRLVNWCFPSGASIINSEVLSYNLDEQTWTHSIDAIQCYVQAEENENSKLLAPGPSATLEAFSTGQSPQCGYFTKTPQTAVLTSPEMELNPGGRVRVKGLKPMITGVQANAITTQVGYRNSQSDSVIYSNPASPTQITGFSDFLIDSRFVRGQTNIRGSFDKAFGGEFYATESSRF